MRFDLAALMTRAFEVSSLSDASAPGVLCLETLGALTLLPAGTPSFAIYLLVAGWVIECVGNFLNFWQLFELANLDEDFLFRGLFIRGLRT